MSVLHGILTINLRRVRVNVGINILLFLVSTSITKDEAFVNLDI